MQKEADATVIKVSDLIDWQRVYEHKQFNIRADEGLEQKRKLNEYFRTHSPVYKSKRRDRVQVPGIYRCQRVPIFVVPFLSKPTDAAHRSRSNPTDAAHRSRARDKKVLTFELEPGAFSEANLVCVNSKSSKSSDSSDMSLHDSKPASNTSSACLVTSSVCQPKKLLWVPFTTLTIRVFGCREPSSRQFLRRPFPAKEHPFTPPDDIIGICLPRFELRMIQFKRHEEAFKFYLHNYPLLLDSITEEEKLILGIASSPSVQHLKRVAHMKDTTDRLDAILRELKQEADTNDYFVTGLFTTTFNPLKWAWNQGEGTPKWRYMV